MFCVLVVLRCARTISEVATVPKVNAVVVNAHVLLQTGNVILMFVETAGLGMCL